VTVGYSLKVARLVIIDVLYLICTSMNKDRALKIRLDSEEYVKLQAYADYKKVSMAHVLREYINHLPDTINPVRR